MPNVGLTNLTAGELSPTMLGRPDVAKFPNGCQRLENFLLTTTGMYSFRIGFELMGFPRDTGLPGLLWPFQFSDQQGYVLEIGNLYFRVWHSLGQVQKAAGDGGGPVEVETLFPSDELSLLGFAQSRDFLFIVNETRGISVIKRFAHDRWTFSTYQLTDGPYGAQNADSTKTLTLGAPTGSDYPVTAAGFSDDEPAFGEGDEGRLIRVKDSTWKWLIVKEVTSATVVVATSQSGAITQTGYVDWRLGLYSERLGWPVAIAIHEQRLAIAGAAANPDRYDLSAIGDFPNFAPTDPLVDNGAAAFAIGSTMANRIVGFSILNDLMLHTAGSTNRTAGDSTGIAITPTQVWQKPVSSDGARRIPPVIAGQASVFVDKHGLNLKALAFDFRFQNYAPDNLTLVADHIAYLAPDSPGIQALQWQSNPFGTLWIIRGNDELAGAMYEAKENVLGWHRHPQGRPYLDGDGWRDDARPACVAPVVESIAVMKGPTHDELWQLVRRELPGRTLRTIERLGRPGLWDTPAERQSWLDCNLMLRNTIAARLVPAATTGQGVTFHIDNVEDGAAFTAEHVGQLIKYRYLAGITIRGRLKWQTAIARIATRVSATEITADILVPFPADLPAASGTWGVTVGRIFNLDHFEGLYVSVVSDGRELGLRRVESGAIDISDAPGWEVSAGLPYQGIAVHMPADPGPQPVVGSGRMARIEKVRARMLNSIGGEFADLPETDDEPVKWQELKPYRQGLAAPSAAPPLFNGDRELLTAGSWTRQATLAIRQRRPMPLNMQMVVVHSYAPWVQP